MDSHSQTEVVTETLRGSSMASREKRHYRSAAAIGSTAVILSFAPNVLAQAVEEATRLDTVTVQGNRLYEMLPSEVTAGTAPMPPPWALKRLRHCVIFLNQ